MLISPVKGRVSSEWSKRRRNPVTGQVTTHAGLDIAAPEGTPVYAMFGGTVLSVRTGSYPGDPHLWNGVKSGNHVAVLNTDGAVQYYGHLKDVFFRKGQKIKAGAKLGTVGRTGLVTGPHLHLETWSNKSLGSHFNPRILFDRYGVKPGSAPKLPSKPKTYTVKAGDTLGGIASKHGTTAAKLAKLNGISNPDVIGVGQRLRLS